jgi:hypothetical protein
MTYAALPKARLSRGAIAANAPMGAGGAQSIDATGAPTGDEQQQASGQQQCCFVGFPES